MAASHGGESLVCGSILITALVLYRLTRRPGTRTSPRPGRADKPAGAPVVSCELTVHSAVARGAGPAAAERVVKASSGAAVEAREQAVNASQLTFEQVRGFLDARQIRYRAGENERTIETRFDLEAGVFPLRIWVTEDPAIVAVVIETPVKAPEERRTHVAELVCRINFGLRVGGYDLDMSRGLVWYHANMPLAETGITEAQFECLLNASLWTVNRYQRAFGRLLFADDLSPAEAVAEVDMAP